MRPSEPPAKAYRFNPFPSVVSYRRPGFATLLKHARTTRPTRPNTFLGHTDHTAGRSCPLDNATAWPSHKTASKSTSKSTAPRRCIIARLPEHAGGQTVSRNFARMPRVHRRRGSVSGEGSCHQKNLTSTPARRPQETPTAGSLPAACARAGRPTRVSARAAEWRHRVRRRGTRAGWPEAPGEEGWQLQVPGSRLARRTV